MTAWQLLILLLADKTCLVFAVMVAINYAFHYPLQRDRESFEPLSAAILSFVFPTPKLDENVTIKMLALGNLLLMISLTLAWSLNLADPWSEAFSQAPIISKEWIEVIFWSSIPMFLAATFPIAFIILIPW